MRRFAAGDPFFEPQPLLVEHAAALSRISEASGQR
jgi:hypothetical protein